MPFAANTVIRHEGDAANHLYMLHDGWVIASAGLSDGSRQVLKVHFPGDVLGAPSLPFSCSAETLRTLTSPVVATVSKAGLAEIFVSLPRLAMLFFLAAQEERVFLMDRLISVGRLRASKRLAAFLLHIYDRLCAMGVSDGAPIDLPMSQEMIADVLGLTTVHTNRVFAQLEMRGLIARRGRIIEFPDIMAVRRFSGIPTRHIVRNQNWLPAMLSR